MMTDTIADMLTRIRNANQRFHKTVSMPLSKMKIKISEILKEEGYIDNFEFKIDNNNKKMLVIVLKYRGKTRVISGLKRVSKPGFRIYAKVNNIPEVLNGLGISIISTNKGIMTGKSARKQQLGGEVIAYVW